MHICFLPIDRVQPYAHNNRKHSDEQIAHIAKSISEFGFNQPIVVDEDFIVIVGHGRLFAAQLLKLPEVPVVTLSGLNEQQKRAYRILDNKLQNDSSWNFENLKIEFEKFSLENFSLEQWGLEDLESVTKRAFAASPHEDDFEASEKDISSCSIKRGDIIQLGRHRIMCGDSTNSEDVGKLLNGERPRLLITDPPYGVDYASKNKFLNSISEGNRIEEDIIGDACTPSEMKAFWFKAFDVAHQHTAPDASYYIFGPQGGDLMMMMMMSIKDANWQLKHMLVWVKNNHVLGRCDYNYKHEPIWFGWKEGQTHQFHGNSSCMSVWEFDRPSRSNMHPTTKPVLLIAQAISNSSMPGDSVLDLFLGSGTTLIAAEQLGRSCFGMEIEPKYCQVIVDRYKAHCNDKKMS